LSSDAEELSPKVEIPAAADRTILIGWDHPTGVVDTPRR
jgi:hypothetical protein